MNLLGSGRCVLGLPDRQVIRPDFTLVTHTAEVARSWPWVPLADVQLVAEVTSRASAVADRRVKPLACAGAAIPYYLLVDRTAVTLFLDPAPAGYLSRCEVPAGRGGGRLAIPALGLIIDASRFPVSARRSRGLRLVE